MIVGIDPGLSGAIALYDGVNGTLEVHDMPVVEMLRNGKKKREVVAALVADLVAGRGITAAYLERVGAMPGQGVTSMFSLGRSVGIIEGVLGAYEIPVTIVPPKTWQKALDVRDGKDGARERAMALFPQHSAQFKRVKDDGRADATLIAFYGHKYGVNA
jgi:crossover junction endodeoxyribonuclease RuvC